MNPPVSLVMIVRDEADHLARCLGSVAGLVDEIVVVDTGSTDATREVARNFGARVSDFPWSDSFSEARNESLRQARGAWAFWLDADEWLDDEARGRLGALIRDLDDAEAVYLMDQASDRVAADRDSLSIAQPRLFPIVDGVRWRYRVHEQILEAWRLRGAPIRPTGVVIRHSGYHSAELASRKHTRNLRLMERDLEDRPGDPWALFQLGRGYLDGRFPEAEGLFLRALASTDATPLMSRQVHALLARGYREQGDMARARSIVREGLRAHPTDAILRFESGCHALQAGDLEAAQGSFRALLASEPDPEEHLIGTYPALRGWRARNHLAMVYLRGGRAAEAEEQWSIALAEKPDAAPAWLGLGELYLTQRRWDDLDRVLRHLRELAPEPDGPLLLLRAQAHLGRGEFAPARTLLAELIARDPAASDLRMLLGWSYLLEGEDLDAAERHLRDVLRADPGHPEAERGLQAIRQGRSDFPRRPNIST